MNWENVLDICLGTESSHCQATGPYKRQLGTYAPQQLLYRLNKMVCVN